MPDACSPYLECFPEEFSIKHKCTEQTEKHTFHLHKQVEIMFALSDNMYCRLEHGTVVHIPAHGMILLGTMDLHYIFAEKNTGLCDRYVLYFSPGFISRFSTPEINLLECFLLRRSGFPPVLLPPDRTGSGELLSDPLVLLQQLERLEQAKEEDLYGKTLHEKLLLAQFLLLVNQLYRRQVGPRCALHKQLELVSDIVHYIQTHYQEHLSTDHLARIFLISKTQLYSLFKETMAITAAEYIQEYRITRAKNLLLNSEQSIEMISQLVGYETNSSFTRAFRQLVGTSPMQYRKTCGGQETQSEP